MADSTIKNLIIHSLYMMHGGIKSITKEGLF